MLRRVAWTTLAVCVLLPQSAAAQEPLSEILVRLIQTRVELAGPPPGSQFPSHQAHFVPGEDQQLAPYLFNQSITSQLSTFPLGSSASGLTYTFDPSLGTYSRNAETFGPSFAERALTIGRGRVGFGASYQHTRFSSFEGKDLDDGEIVFHLQHTDSGGAFFEGDVVRAALSMRLKTDTFSLFASYGIADRLDVAVALPIVRVDLDATVDASVLRLATGETGPASQIHAFPGGLNSTTFAASGSASGIGDVLLRVKYRFLDAPGGGLAAAVDIRTPTGDADDLLGAGAAQAKFLLVGSTASGRFSPHFNVGYTVSGEPDNPFLNAADEVNYAGGLEFAAMPTLTITGDLVGRQLRDAGRLVETPTVFNWMMQNGTSGSTTLNEFALEPGHLNLLYSSLGAKFNPFDNLVVSANVLFPLTDSGIRSRPVPVVAFDYSF